MDKGLTGNTRKVKLPRRASEWRALATYLRSVRPGKERRLNAPWQDTGTGLTTRQYGSYEEYVRHQASKLDTLFWLDDYDKNYRSALGERLVAGGYVRWGLSALCLAARVGTEVKAFQDHGCFAVGTDLNPGGVNGLVLLGDFHDVQFPAQCVDIVFTNSLDHSPMPGKVIEEMARVVKPEGRLIVEIGAGAKDGGGAKYYEASAWEDPEYLLPYFLSVGFANVYSSPFEYPWKGWHWVLERE